MALAECAGSDLPYAAYTLGGSVVFGSHSSTQGGACMKAINGDVSSGTVMLNTQDGACFWTNMAGSRMSLEIRQLCNNVSSPSSGSVGTSTGAVTVTVQPAQLTGEEVADYGQMFASMTFVLVVVWGLRQLLNLFNGKFDS